MRSFSKHVSFLAILSTLAAALPVCWAQEAGGPRKWEVGALGGGSFYNSAPVSGPAGSGDAGIKNGLAVGGFVGNDVYRLLGGEIRYEYLPGDLKVSSGGASATFNGQAHAIHYDFLFHFAPSGSHIRPFVSAGGGVKIYQGTSSATVTQPLSALALLTNTHETKGLGVFGGGIKARLTRHAMLRFEVQDFLTPFPRQVIAPAPGAKISGLLNEIVFMAGLGFTF
jgi:outer membrane protein with beta-barrel domain